MRSIPGSPRTTAFAVIVGLAALGGLAGCAKKSTADTTLAPVAAASTPAPTPTRTPLATPTGGGANTTAQQPGGGNPTTSTSDWPPSSDCISYNPNNLTVSFSNDTYIVSDGNNQVIKVAGQTGDSTGQAALALAQRYRRHCFLGRGNGRDDHYQYVFDYWRDRSGQKPPIPGEDDNCSSYNRKNLTVEDMGDGNGWRVKDHDHVLHLFDNSADAHNGDLVLVKYGEICQIGDNGDGSVPMVDYSK